MCEEGIRKMRKSSQVKRLREARRQTRIPRQRAPPSDDDSQSSPTQINSQLTLAQQHFVYADLTMRTAALMQKSQEIQDKISALKQETADFVASVMNNGTDNVFLMQLKLYSTLKATR